MADIERQKRHEALEEKRRRLEEMKRSREKKGGETASAASSSRAEVDDLVSALLDTNNSGPSSAKKDAVAAAAAAIMQPSTNVPAQGAVSAASRTVLLSTVKGVASVRNYPAAVEAYDKESQTDFGEAALYKGVESGGGAADSSHISPVKLGHRRTRQAMNSINFQHPSPSHTSSSAEPVDGAEGRAGKENMISASAAAPASQKKHVVMSEIERSLQQPEGLCVDVLKDYRHDGGAALSTSTSKNLSIVATLQEPSVRGRPVMDLHVSPHHPELFLACYGASAEASSSGRGGIEGGKPGLVCVWSLAFKARPEFTFHAPSPVLTARFHDFDPYIIVGSCYSGQVVLWDMRVRGGGPSQQSSAAGKGHKHPVYSIFMSGSAAAHELLTISTDGLLCTWDVGRLSEPTTHHLLASGGGGGEETFPMTICNMTHIARDGGSEIIFGTGSGSIMRAALPFRSHDPIQYHADAHMGLVTALAVHPLSNSKQHADMLLTSSFDWTVKLWNFKTSAKPLAEFSSQSYDYVCDVKWCPSCASVFATITSGGDVAVWDMNKSLTSHADLLKIAPSTPGAALNKCHWAADGRLLLLGDSRGDVRVCSVGDALMKHDEGVVKAAGVVTGLVAWKNRAATAVTEAHK